MTLKELKADFIAHMVAAISDVDMGGFFPSVLIAQAAIESNWGRSSLSKRYNNYFGIKAGKSWKGKTVNMKTGEVFNGEKVTIRSNFRVYDCVADSLADRNRLLRTKRYKTVEPAATPLLQATAIRESGYCTATNYVHSIMLTINANDLTKYDTPKKSEYDKED